MFSKLLGKLLCAMGFHKWKIVKVNKCKVTVGSMFSGSYKTDGEARIEDCSRPGCPYRRGILSNGFTTQVVSTDRLIRAGFLM